MLSEIVYLQGNDKCKLQEKIFRKKNFCINVHVLCTEWNIEHTNGAAKIYCSLHLNVLHVLSHRDSQWEREIRVELLALHRVHVECVAQ